MRRPVIVSVRPPVSAMLNNRLFDGSSYQHFGDATHWMQPYRVLREEGRRRGFELVTEDLVTPDKASVFLMMELPQSPEAVRSIRQKHPNLKIVLQILESPLGRQWVFDRANHQLFDAVLTYSPKLGGSEKHFIYKLPAGGVDEWSGLANEMPWHERRTACLVANVPNCRPMLPRRSGLGVMRAGWRFSVSTWWNYITEQDSLYGERLAVARSFSEQCPGAFDIYGPGWASLSIDSVRRAARGVWAGSKLDLLGKYRFNIAFENCLNDCGYISEKIFDAFLAGTVPVYLGNRRIVDVIPKESFVDAGEFRSAGELARYVEQVSCDDWREMHAAGAAFLDTHARDSFGSMQYAHAVFDAVRYVLAMNTATLECAS
jgi:hypothetical protein